MYEMKSTKKPASKTTIKKQTLETNYTEIAILSGKVLGGVAIVGSILFGGYKLFYKPPVPVWTNYDIVLSTGDKILHQQTKSIKNFTSDDPLVDDKDAGMFLSVKKIDNKDAVWFVDFKNDFECISTATEKCSIDISFDNSPPKQFAYDGGAMRTIYMLDAHYLVNKIKSSKEIKISTRFKRVEMSPTEKSQISLANNGKYVDSFSKESTFKVQGLIWK